MKVGLITIGNELLSGFTTDTNAAWIGQKMLNIGANLSWHLTVGDTEEEIINGIKSAPEGLNAIIITGGLGPTHDDITASAIYRLVGANPVFDEDYWQELKHLFEQRNIKIPEMNRNQAVRPDVGDVIPNPRGSARGLHFTKDGIDLFALPGVPAEMKGMMNETVLPFLEKKIKSKIFTVTMRTTGIAESALAEKLKPIISQANDVNIAFLPRMIEVDIRLTASNKTKLESVQSQIVDSANKYIFGQGDMNLETAVADLLKRKKKTIGTAESCSGGLISDRLTNVPGSSSYMIGGITAYSNDVKIAQLNVKQETLEKSGAVSEETALEMAHGVRKVLRTDLGLSTTGIAGPDGGTEEKPVGLVYIALAHESGEKARKFNLTRDRKLNKLLTSQIALNMVRLHLTYE